MTTESKPKFKSPIPGLNSVKPYRIKDIGLTEVVKYHFTIDDSPEAHTAPFNNDPGIPNADPYASDYYDSLIQIKYQVNSLCKEFMEMGIYTEKQLTAIYLKEDASLLFSNINQTKPIIESGILRNFKLSNSYALKLSRETVELIKKYRDIVLIGKISDDQLPRLLIPLHYFKCLRHIYSNIGKMDALVCYFESVQSNAQKKNTNPNTSRIQYQTEVKQILINLLEKYNQSRSIKFNTISAAVNTIKSEFEEQYEILKKKNADQQYFHIDHLIRNIQTFQRKDAAFKAKISKFIVIKH